MLLAASAGLLRLMYSQVAGVLGCLWSILLLLKGLQECFHRAMPRLG